MSTKSEIDVAREFLRFSKSLYAEVRTKSKRTDAEERFLRAVDRYQEFLDREARKERRKNWKVIKTEEP